MAFVVCASGWLSAPGPRGVAYVLWLQLLELAALQKSANRLEVNLKITFNTLMATKTCSRRALATGDLAMVEQCSCGAVHVSIGAVTLRLAPSAIASLAATMSDAARRLGAEHELLRAGAQDEILS